MKILVLSHASFEGLGSIADWAQQRGHHICTVYGYRGEALPEVESFDGVITMGGPQSAVEVERYDYLQQEAKWLGKAAAAGKPILGVCLGAQMLGIAFGASAEKSPEREIGFFPIELTETGQSSDYLKGMPSDWLVGHWHNDMPGLPKGAEILASSLGCPRQIIAFADRVLGLQCHVELTRPVVEGFIEKCAEDLRPGPYVQTAETMLQTNFDELAQQMHTILDRLFG